MDRHLLTSK